MVPKLVAIYWFIVHFSVAGKPPRCLRSLDTQVGAVACARGPWPGSSPSVAFRSLDISV